MKKRLTVYANAWLKHVTNESFFVDLKKKKCNLAQLNILQLFALFFLFPLLINIMVYNITERKLTMDIKSVTRNQVTYFSALS